MALDWTILRTSEPVDIAGNFAQGYKIGSALLDKFHERNALAALATRPDDPSALATLYQVNPNMAAHFEARGEQRRRALLEQQARERQAALGQRYTTDPQGAREAAIAGGDFDLAKTFGELDKTAQEKTSAFWAKAGPIAYSLKQQRDPAKRQALWQEAKGILAREGADPAQLEGFDPTNDAQLDAAITMSQKLSELVDQNKVVWHQQGEQPSFATDAMGRPIGSQNPYAHGNAGVTAAPQASAVATTLATGGLPAPVVAGFLGNFHVEGGYGGAAGDGGKSKGIAQWNGERASNFARVIGKPVEQAAPEEQAKFVLWEMQNPEAAGMSVAQRDAIMAAKSPQEAAALIDQFYERSSGEHRQRRVDAAGSIGAPVRLASKAEFDKLPSGAEFIAPDGTHRRKP